MKKGIQCQKGDGQRIVIIWFDWLIRLIVDQVILPLFKFSDELMKIIDCYQWYSVDCHPKANMSV